MKNLKKLLALLLALAMVLSFAACGKEEDANNTESTESTDGTENIGDNQETGNENNYQSPTHPSSPNTAAIHIEKGEYQKAYDLLISADTLTKEEENLLKCFRSLTLEEKGSDGSVKTNTYDQNGTLLSTVEYSADGSQSETVYTYDLFGNKLTETTTFHDGTQKSHTYTYDVTDTLVASHSIDSYGNEEHYTYTYDETSKLLIKAVSNQKTYTYTYDGSGNLLTESCTDSRGNQSETVNTYDQYGNKTGATKTTGDSTVTYTYTWKPFYDPAFTEEVSSTLITARKHVEKGEYQEAYDLLIAIENPTRKENTLLSCFRFQLLSGGSDQGAADEYVYDAHGNTLYQNNRDEHYHIYTRSYTYDENQNLITFHFVDFGDDVYDTVYTYNEINQLTAMTETHRSGHETWVTYYTYTYDDNGNLLTEITSNDADILSTTTYTYDEKGNLLSEVFISNQEFIQSYTITYAYGARGNLLKKDRRAENSWSTEFYSYDSQGNIMGKYSCDSHGNWSKTIYTFNENGDIVAESNRQKSGYWSDTTYTYDENGKLLSKSSVSRYDSNGTTFTYDAYGNTIRITYYVYSYEVGDDVPTTYTCTWKLFYNPKFALEANN